MFGGYFGDFIDVFSRVYLHKPVTVKPVWFAPLNEPMRLLVFSMLFGLIHMFLGMGLKGYMLFRDRKYLDFFYDVVLWFLLLMGLILIFYPKQHVPFYFSDGLEPSARSDTGGQMDGHHRSSGNSLHVRKR